MSFEINTWYKLTKQNTEKLKYTKRGELEYSEEILIKYYVEEATGARGTEFSLGRIIKHPNNQYSVNIDKERDYLTDDPSKRVKIIFQEFFLFKL